MKSKTTTEEFLRNTPLPEQTETYTVISHGSVIDKAREVLALNGFTIKEELYKGSATGEVALGFFHLENDNDPDMGMTLNWANSYNKKLRFGCSIGGFIYANKVQFVTDESKANWIRKHTGTALEETNEIITAMVEQAHDHFEKIIKMKNKFIKQEVSDKDYAKLMGLLYFDKQIMTSEQINVVKREYKKPSFQCDHKGTLWGLYKIIMYAVVDQTSDKWYNQQVQLNNYIQVMFNIAKEEIVSEFTIDDMDDDIETLQEDSEETQENNLTEEQIELIKEEYEPKTSGDDFDIDVKTTTFPKPTIFGAESQEEEDEVMKALIEAGLAPEQLTSSDKAMMADVIDELEHEETIPEVHVPWKTDEDSDECILPKAEKKQVLELDFDEVEEIIFLEEDEDFVILEEEDDLLSLTDDEELTLKVTLTAEEMVAPVKIIAPPVKPVEVDEEALAFANKHYSSVIDPEIKVVEGKNCKICTIKNTGDTFVI